MDEIEKEVSSAQYPEFMLSFGMGLGILLPMVSMPGRTLVIPVASFGGGVGGYLLGHLFESRKLRRLREESGSTNEEHG